ncbi:BA14K family protein [Roseibium denhamense]|nr:BA14K family protein [Roseibium denhamense]MTI07560.1 BA14K family protein [Roseibium denhamense]
MFKKFATTSVALALVAGASLALPAQSAKAAEGWQVGVGIAGGLAAGAILGSALSQPRYHAAPRYYAPPPVYHPAPVVTYRPAPWSPAWYNYCSRKYRSFNPRTGYFLAYSGQYKFCR